MTIPASSHAGPPYRAPMCVTIEITKTLAVSSAPTSEGIGTRTPRTRTLSPTRNGRRRSGCVRRSRTIASCAAVKASSTPKLKRLARNVTGFVRNAVPSSSAIAIPHAATTDCGETSVRRCRRPNARGSWPCSPSEYASRPNPEIDVVAAESSTSAPVSPT